MLLIYSNLKIKILVCFLISQRKKQRLLYKRKNDRYIREDSGGKMGGFGIGEI